MRQQIGIENPPVDYIEYSEEEMKNAEAQAHKLWETKDRTWRDRRPI